MTWRVEEAAFTLVGFPEPPLDADLAALASPPAQVVREADETTLLVGEDRVGPILERHPGARVERDLAWIRFDTPMGWEVVGFLALVTAELARARVPIGVVCGYGRDHLFLARKHLPATRQTLERLLGKCASDGAGG